jgi:hypothetical protein
MESRGRGGGARRTVSWEEWRLGHKQPIVVGQEPRGLRVREAVVVVVVALVGVVGVREEDAESSAFLHDATAPSGGGARKAERSFRSAPYTLAERAVLVALRDKADEGVPQRHGARLC